MKKTKCNVSYLSLNFWGICWLRGIILRKVQWSHIGDLYSQVVELHRSVVFGNKHKERLRNIRVSFNYLRNEFDENERV